MSRQCGAKQEWPQTASPHRIADLVALGHGAVLVLALPRVQREQVGDALAEGAAAGLLLAGIVVLEEFLREQK